MKWTQKKLDPVEKWFAWYPVKLDGTDDFVWWQSVYRYWIAGGWGDGFYSYAETREICLENIRAWRGK